MDENHFNPFRLIKDDLFFENDINIDVKQDSTVDNGILQQKHVMDTISEKECKMVSNDTLSRNSDEKTFTTFRDLLQANRFSPDQLSQLQLILASKSATAKESDNLNRTAFPSTSPYQSTILNKREDDKHFFTNI